MKDNKRSFGEYLKKGMKYAIGFTAFIVVCALVMGYYWEALAFGCLIPIYLLMAYVDWRNRG